MMFDDLILASSVGLCHRRKPWHPHHEKVSPRGTSTEENEEEKKKEKRKKKKRKAINACHFSMNTPQVEHITWIHLSSNRQVDGVGKKGDDDLHIWDNQSIDGVWLTFNHTVSQPWTDFAQSRPLMESWVSVTCYRESAVVMAFSSRARIWGEFSTVHSLPAPFF